MKLKIDKLNEKGYGVCRLEDKVYWVLGTLPGELVEVEVIKKKKGINFCSIVEIIEPSKFRVEPRDNSYLATSPWQIMSFERELEIKKQLIAEYFEDKEVEIPQFKLVTDSNEWHYRNKVEFSFYTDENNFSQLAFFKRDSKGAKIIIDGMDIAPKPLVQSAFEIQDFLNSSTNLDNKFRQIKGLMIRHSFTENKGIVVLFLKDKIKIDIESVFENSEYLKGLFVYYSDRRSPNFNFDELIEGYGEFNLEENLLDKKFIYSAEAFFQVNPPLFQKTLLQMRKMVEDLKPKRIIDVYSGVGTIGLSLVDLTQEIITIELFKDTIPQIQKNCEINNISNVQSIQGKAEDKLKELNLNSQDLIILDPPRSGLHPKLIETLLAILPENIIYLSCNPKTLAHDLSLLKANYEIVEMEAYNFYPKTPHVENLVKLKRVKT